MGVYIKQSVVCSVQWSKTGQWSWQDCLLQGRIFAFMSRHSPSWLQDTLINGRTLPHRQDILHHEWTLYTMAGYFTPWQDTLQHGRTIYAMTGHFTPWQDRLNQDRILYATTGHFNPDRTLYTMTGLFASWQDSLHQCRTHYTMAGHFTPWQDTLNQDRILYPTTCNITGHFTLWQDTLHKDRNCTQKQDTLHHDRTVHTMTGHYTMACNFTPMQYTLHRYDM